MKKIKLKIRNKLNLPEKIISKYKYYNNLNMFSILNYMIVDNICQIYFLQLFCANDFYKNEIKKIYIKTWNQKISD